MKLTVGFTENGLVRWTLRRDDGSHVATLHGRTSTDVRAIGLAVLAREGVSLNDVDVTFD